ncbi:MAG: hypothetical protein V3V33_16090 [Candidatus Lokiarchaeia archaeon]
MALRDIERLHGKNGKSCESSRPFLSIRENHDPNDIVIENRFKSPEMHRIHTCADK